MVLHIALGIILAVAMCFVSSTFWQLLKRERFLKRIICDQHYLEGFISRDVLKNPPPRIEPFLEKHEIGYVLNIKIVSDADKNSLRRAKIIFTFLLMIVLAGNYFLGWLYIIINCIIFFLFNLVPLSQDGQHNALEHVYTIAIILHKWRSEDLEECDQWIEQAWSLRPLYNAVKIAESTSLT